jgi:hypothetical protein
MRRPLSRKAEKADPDPKAIFGGCAPKTAKNILLCTRTHVISTVTKKSTLGKKAVSETPLFPKKTALEKRAVSEMPLFKGRF